ncbi:MAG: LON peptidase substrate-binding domain-containing protein [Spongiibacteraceae bacterium]
MTELPLFPLRAVLFPHGRMPLKIFEPRYVDLVSDSLKHEREFGVVWIREGGEVVLDADHAMPRLAQIGCTARIVDWDALPNGRFGITIEGGSKFRVLSTQQRPNFLVVAETEFLPAEESIDVPAHAQDMIELLRQLMEHPAIARLNIEPQLDDAGRLANQLAQLLPIPESSKFALLAEFNPQERLDRLLAILEQISS